MTRPLFLLAGALLCTLTLSNRPAQAGGTYVESFNTTTSKDPGTSANWDTGAGELKLHAFTPSLVGNYDTPGTALGVAVAGNLAFVADEASGLRIIDITNPALPTPVGSYDTPGLAWQVALAGDLAFVADDATGLIILNISNPASPTLVGTYNSPGAAVGVVVDGDFAFVADAFSGLRILNITNPASPTSVGVYNTPGLAFRVAVAGDLAFVADESSGVWVINISTPATPVLVGGYNTSGAALDIAVAGDLAFVADEVAGLRILDITNPASPTLIGTYDTPGLAYGLTVEGDRVFVADEASGLQIIDISNPASPTLDHAFDTPGLTFGVVLAGEHAFVADQLSGLQIVKITDAASIRQVGFFNPTGTTYRVAVAGDLLLAACDFSGLKIINISNPGSPTLVGTYDTPARTFGVAVAGDLAFIADDTEGLKIINISNPASPTLVGSLDTPDHAEDVAVAGNLAFVADRHAGLRIIDITNPASPVLTGFYDTAGQSYAVTLAGDLAFVGDAGSVEIINISNPASPSLVVSYDMEGFTRQVALDGDLAFVADGDFGLKIVDISNPASPSLVAAYDTPGTAIGVTVAGNFAFVADQVSGLLVFDITTPSSPALVGGYDTFANAWDIVVAGDVVYLADTFGGLYVIEVFNHRFYTRSDIGQSLDVDATDDVIVAARLSSTQTPSVTWEISANGGTNSQSITPDNAWYPIDIEGNNLRWRSRHALTGWPGANPTVSDLQIEWLYEFATIDAITDIPDDQGGWVRLSATRSGRDFAAETLPISHYGVWRRVDTSPMAAALASAPRDVSTIDPSIVEAFGALPIFGHGRDVYVESAPGQLTGTLPPGTWALVTNVPALQQQTYLADVPTLADETLEGIEYTVFVLTAHTTTPSIWYASPTANGYSIDNIAPGVPTGFAIAYNTGGGNTLSWDPSQDDDFQYFRVYRSTDPDFTPSPGTLVHATATTGWSDPDYDGWEVYYKVTALDYVGNESGPATGTMTSVDGPRGPASAALYQNHPNPFNPTTQIRYDVPLGGADVLLAIYDVSGRRVRVLVSGRDAAGEKSVRWDARDDAGVSVATGIYFCRVTIGDFAATRKMVLLK